MNSIKNAKTLAARKLTEIPGAIDVENVRSTVPYCLNVDTNSVSQVENLSRYDIPKQVAVLKYSVICISFKKDEYDLVVTSNIQSMDELKICV
ncbi:hypothetical protein KHA80_08220 [Anaerobacillus sp. HL2]|nr:hypothetical protein KHA80_08220 [Anaerobacillus sp. HL2]